MSAIENFCDVMALLRKRPRSVIDLAEVSGLCDRTVRAYVRALHSEGHVHVLCWRQSAGRPAPVYAWQGEPHAHKDADPNADHCPMNLHGVPA